MKHLVDIICVKTSQLAGFMPIEALQRLCMICEQNHQSRQKLTEKEEQ